MATLKISSDLQNIIKKVVLDTYFPVGSLYLTVGNENPNTTIGGTWTKLSGYYLYADTSINNTSYTGKNTQSHALTTNQIPAHTHGSTSLTGSLYAYDYIGKRATGIVFETVINDEGVGFSTSSTNKTPWKQFLFNATHEHTSVGGGQGHSHNIATKGIYVWQRTA